MQRILALTVVLSNSGVGDCLASFNLSSLKFVSVIARHGSRASFSSFPNDPYHPRNRQFWPYGPAELTKIGRQQSFAVGLHLRTRYDGFLSEFYDKNQVSIHSNLFSRGMLSAELIAAGLFPPTGYQLWNETMPWQPVEVWPFDFDVVDIENKCPQFLKWQKSKTLRVVNDIKSEKVFIDETIHFTGFPYEQIVNQIKTVYDPLIAERENGFELPDWADDAFMDKLRGITTKWWIARLVGSVTQIRVVGGPNVRRLVEQLTSACDHSALKLTVLVVHDVTITALLYGLGIHEEMIPGSSSYVAFELHENSSGSFVQILFFNDSSTTVPTTLEMSECPHPCQLDEFMTQARKTVPDNWDLECLGATSASCMSLLSPVLIVSFFIVTIVQFCE